MSLHATERPAPLRSRVHRARHVLGELRRLRLKLQLAYTRAATDEERHWVRATADALDLAIVAGEAVLDGFADPRPARKARKRQTDSWWEGE